MFIDGQWINSSDGKTIDIVNPDSGEIYAVVPEATLDDVRKAINSAYTARHDWSAILPQDRAHILFTASRQVLKNADEIAEILVMESGSAIRKAMYEVQKTADYIRARGEEITRIRGETLPSLMKDKFSIMKAHFMPIRNVRRLEG